MLTAQEMLDRAWRGLAGQGWRKAAVVSANGMYICEYLAANGDRCAWGHVDNALTSQMGSVEDLHHESVGVAASLDEDTLWFAKALQAAHDDSTGPEDMQERIRKVAARWNLSIPEAA